MSTHSEKGLWPVMLTPFTQEGEIDYPSLERLIAWYEENGAEGLFAACQSSEIFFLSLKERVELVRFVKSHAHVPTYRIPVQNQQGFQPKSHPNI